MELARHGADVVVHGFRSVDRAQEIAQQIQSLGRQAIAETADLADTAQRARFAQRAWDWQSRINIWVNNAGFDAITGDAAEWDFERKLNALWTTDVLATIHCSRDVGSRMKAAGSGQIINIGWDQAWQGMEGDSGEMFAATKGAIMAFTKSSAKSLAPEVRVNCVSPGWIQTKWGNQHASEYWNRRAVSESLRSRWGTPEDVAMAVCYLASSHADFINGHILPVNGGFCPTPLRKP